MLKIDKNSKQIEISKKFFNIELKPHQKSLIYKGLQLDGKFKNTEFKFGMFSDPPGSGKTYVILSLIYFIKIFEKKRNCFLIVIPHNIYSQWKASIEKIYKGDIKCKFITENKDINNLYSNNKSTLENDIIIITPILYSSLVQATTFNNFHFRSVFFDEVDTIHKLLNYNILTEMIWFISASIHTMFDEQNLKINVGPYELYLPNLKSNDCSCDIKYIQECMEIKNPFYKKYICKNFYVDNIFTNFLGKETLKGINSHNYGTLTKECGDVNLESFNDVLKNLYLYSNKMLISKKESIKETDKYVKFAQNDADNYLITKQKLINEFAELQNIVEIIKNLCQEHLICINCFNLIKLTDIENEFKSKNIDYYKTPCDNNICFNCIYEIIKNTADIENDDKKIKIDCVECCNHHTKYSLELQHILRCDEEYLFWDKFVMLENILNTCNKKILLYCDTRKEINLFLENYYNKKNQKYLELIGGNVEEITNIIDDFKNNKNIKLLFINDLSLSNGLNLEFTDDLILFNYLKPKILDQVIGRVLRYPRKKKLNIFHLLYKNENYLK